MQNRLRFRTARELFNAFATASGDMKAVPTDESSIDFCHSLLNGKIPEEAVTFCAYLLPRRIAVWWGHQCLARLKDVLDEQDCQMLTLAEEWVREPEEDSRYAALDAALAARVKTPGVWIALAAGWSGGSLAPRGLAPVTPPPYLTPRAVNTAVLAALARRPMAVRRVTLRDLVEMGLNLAQG